MTRIPLATDLKTRTGAPDKDARLTNCYVETRGDQSVVRKRAVAQGGVSVGTGVAQGGIGLHINGVDYIYTVNGDVGALNDISVGTTWNSGTSYSTGDHVSVGFVDYWALTDNSNSQPPSDDWSDSYVPAVPFSYIVQSGDYSWEGQSLTNHILIRTITSVTLFEASPPIYGYTTICSVTLDGEVSLMPDDMVMINGRGDSYIVIEQTGTNTFTCTYNYSAVPQVGDWCIWAFAAIGFPDVTLSNSHQSSSLSEIVDLIKADAYSSSSTTDVPYEFSVTTYPYFEGRIVLTGMMTPNISMDGTYQLDSGNIVIDVNGTIPAYTVSTSSNETLIPVGTVLKYYEIGNDPDEGWTFPYA